MDLYHIKRKGNKEVLKRNESRGVEYLTFPSLEKTGIVSHLFSTRIGGASEGISASMNLSYARGDRKEAVDEKYRILSYRIRHIRPMSVKSRKKTGEKVSFIKRITVMWTG